MNRVEEWIGGRFPAPALITGGDVPVRPELSLWIEVGGPIVGMKMEPPGARFAPTVALLRSSMEKPLDGPPRRPARVRVAEPELAQALRAELGSEIDVVLAPTREFDDVLDSLREFFGRDPDGAPAWFEGEGASGSRIAAFFHATAKLYRSAPWNIVPSNDDLLTVDIEALAVRGQVVSIIGKLGESLGIIVFHSRSDFEQYLAEAEHSQRTRGIAELPHHLSLTFEPSAEVPEGMRATVAENGWEIASNDAYPVAFALRGLVPQDLSAKDLALLEALSSALADLVSADPGFGRALEEGLGLDRVFAVDAAGQRVEVRLRVSARPRPGKDATGAFDIRGEKRDDEGRLDEAWAAEFEREVLDRFAKSPEADGMTVSWTGSVLHFGSSYLDASLGQIGAAELREILFEVFPRKMSCEPESAGEIVTELRAFWTWARREFQLETAEECLAVLRPGAEQALRRELADTGKFGMAKSMFMAASSSGYDVTTQEGLDRFVADVNAGNVPFPDGSASVAARPAVPRDRHKEKERKKKRKAERAARRRNR